MNSMNRQLDQKQQEQLKRFCERWNIDQMELFGSILDPFSEPNDRIKVLLKFGPDAAPTLGNRMNMELDLQKIFNLGRQVDLYSHAGIDRNIIPIHRDIILNKSSLQIYPLADANEEKETAE